VRRSGFPLEFTLPLKGGNDNIEKTETAIIGIASSFC
jgi:hypothetical protein